LPRHDQPAAAGAETPRPRNRFVPAEPAEQPAMAAEANPAPERIEEAVAIEAIFPAEDQPAPPPAEPEAAEASGFVPPTAEEENYAPPMVAEEAVAEAVEPVAESAEVAAAEAPEPATADQEPGSSRRVSDLEKEMARLLGEISGRR
jgi:hypothetical protein